MQGPIIMRVFADAAMLIENNSNLSPTEAIILAYSERFKELPEEAEVVEMVRILKVASDISNAYLSSMRLNLEPTTTVSLRGLPPPDAFEA